MHASDILPRDLAVTMYLPFFSYYEQQRQTYDDSGIAQRNSFGLNKMKTENRSTCPILVMQRDVRVLFSSETVCNMSSSLLPFNCIHKHFRKNIISYYYYIIKIYLMYIVHNIFTNIYQFIKTTSY